jgi:hypothetical protein
MQEKRPAKTWQESGTGNPPLLWSLKYLPRAVDEARILTPQQYWHMADQLCEICRERDPRRCPVVEIARIEDFWELKDKGGPLGKINLRVFFFVDTAKQRHDVVVLGVHKKEDEDQLRRSVVVRIARRKRLYLQRLNERKA